MHHVLDAEHDEQLLCSPTLCDMNNTRGQTVRAHGHGTQRLVHQGRIWRHHAAKESIDRQAMRQNVVQGQHQDRTGRLWGIENDLGCMPSAA